MEVLVLDGKRYTKASKAARDLGYTSDYVGQLCRSGQVSAHLIGRTWYVDTEGLGTHRQEKKRMSRVKAREQAKRSIAEHRAKKETKEKNYTNIAISYEKDDSELIPETRRINIKTEGKASHKTRTTPKEPKGPIIENEGEKIIMRGNLKGLDASDDYADTETTILEPEIVTEKKKSATDKKLGVRTRERAPEQAEMVVPRHTDFKEKLAKRDAISLTTEEETVENTASQYDTEDLILENTEQEGSAKHSLISLPVLVGTVLTLVFLGTLPLYQAIEYSSDLPDPVSKSYSFEFKKTFESVKELF